MDIHPGTREPREADLAATRRRTLGWMLGAGAALVLPRLARAAYEVRTWPASQPAPGLALSDLDSKPWRLSDLAGRAVVLNFWATWCDPCRAEMPSLQQLAATHRSDGLAVLAVNYKESVPVIRRFLQTLPFELPVLLDSDGEATAAWTPRVFPTTVLIGPGGVPRSLVVGEMDWMGAAARELIEPLLARARRT